MVFNEPAYFINVLFLELQVALRFPVPIQDLLIAGAWRVELGKLLLHALLHTPIISLSPLMLLPPQRQVVKGLTTHRFDQDFEFRPKLPWGGGRYYV
jgi:hypothetical protein